MEITKLLKTLGSENQVIRKNHLFSNKAAAGRAGCRNHFDLVPNTVGDQKVKFLTK